MQNHAGVIGAYCLIFVTMNRRIELVKLEICTKYYINKDSTFR